MSGQLDRATLEAVVKREAGKKPKSGGAKLRLPIEFDTSRGLEPLVEVLQQKLELTKKLIANRIPPEAIAKMWEKR